MKRFSLEGWKSSRGKALPRIEKISERLPHFYKHWEQNSFLFSLISALGKRLDESEKEIVAIMRAYWVDTATGIDLDRHGALFNLKRKESETDPYYRNRLKAAIISYKGGGTKSAIQMLVKIALKLPQDYPDFKIDENPAVERKKKWKGSAGGDWMVDPINILDTVPDITIEVETENSKITDPTITNLTTGELITFRGDLFFGDVLNIRKGAAILNDHDETVRLSTLSIPSLPRKITKWQFIEYAGANQGRFDSTNFDEAVFVIKIISSVTFEWSAKQPAAFDVILPKDLIMKAGVTAEFMQEIVNSVKACGVKAEVRVI